jgi:hypothetical protein
MPAAVGGVLHILHEHGNAVFEKQKSATENKRGREGADMFPTGTRLA